MKKAKTRSKRSSTKASSSAQPMQKGFFASIKNITKLSAIALIAIIAFASLTIGILLIAVSGKTGFEKLNSDEAVAVNQTSEFDLARMQTAVINVDSIDVHVTRGNVTAAVASLHGKVSASDNSSSLKLRISSGDDVEIYVERTDIWSLFYFEELDLDLVLPEDYAGTVIVNGASSDIDFSGGEYLGVECNTASGDVEIEDVDGAEFKFNTASGNLIIARSSLKNLEISTASGDVDVDSEITGKTRISTASGNVDLDYSRLNDEVLIDTASGDVSLKIPSHSDANLHYSTFSGDFDSRLPFTIENSDGYDIKGMLGNGLHDLRINTASGNLDIAAND